jgi:hypothetical protein
VDGKTPSANERLSSLQAEIRADFAEFRLHAVMLNERLRDDLRRLAAAVAVLTVKVESLIVKVDSLHR